MNDEIIWETQPDETRRSDNGVIFGAGSPATGNLYWIANVTFEQLRS